MPLESDYREDRKPGQFLSGRFVNLRALTESDALNTDWYDWFNDELTCRTLQQHLFPNDPQLQLEFFRNLRADRTRIQLGIVTKEHDQLIGVVSLSSVDYVNRNAEFSIVIGRREQRRRQVSLEALKLLFEHGFFTLNLHKIYGGSLPMLRAWQEALKAKLGFHDEGTWTEHAYKDGQYLDIHRIGLLKSEFVKHRDSFYEE